MANNSLHITKFHSRFVVNSGVHMNICLPATHSANAALKLTISKVRTTTLASLNKCWRVINFSSFIKVGRIELYTEKYRTPKLTLAYPGV